MTPFTPLPEQTKAYEGMRYEENMSKLCKLRLHRMRMVHYSAFPFVGGQIFSSCTRCGKYDWEIYEYWDTFWDGVTYYNYLEMFDKFNHTRSN